MQEVHWPPSPAAVPRRPRNGPISAAYGIADALATVHIHRYALPDAESNSICARFRSALSIPNRELRR